MENGAVALENSLAVVQKVINFIVTIQPHNSPPGYTPERHESTHPQKNLHTNVHSSVIHNGQKVEATQMAISC